MSAAPPTAVDLRAASARLREAFARDRLAPKLPLRFPSPAAPEVPATFRARS